MSKGELVEKLVVEDPLKSTNTAWMAGGDSAAEVRCAIDVWLKDLR